MAYYDPYSFGQYDFKGDSGYEYNDAYNPYGYSEYGEAYPQTPPPPPDENWVDPAKTNKDYLKKIQKLTVHEDFCALKESGLFSIEVQTRYIALKKEMLESHVSLNENEKLIKPLVHIKLLDFPFILVSDTPAAIGNENRSGSSVTNGKSFTNLFQEVFTATGTRHDSLLPKTDEPMKKPSPKSSKETLNSSSLKKSNTEELKEQPSEMDTFKVMKGKCVLIPMIGLSMVQNLQQHPLYVRVETIQVSEEEDKAESLVLGTATLTLSETFVRAVLLSCKTEAVLPIVAVNTAVHKLTDSNGEEVGEVELTVALTCFGKSMVNCISESVEGYSYENTIVLRNLKANPVLEDDHIRGISPKLAKEILRLGLFFPIEKSSQEILANCALECNLLNKDEEKEKRNISECKWFSMLKEIQAPPSLKSFDSKELLHELEMERARMWMKHKQVCRKQNNMESISWESLKERFREIQLLRGTESDSTSRKSLCGSWDELHYPDGTSRMDTKHRFFESIPYSGGGKSDVDPSLVSSKTLSKESPKKKAARKSK